MRILILLVVGLLGLSSHTFAQEDLVDVNKRLQKSARDLGKKLFPLVLKNDVKGITDLHVSAADVKTWVDEKVFDMLRMKRHFEISKRGPSPEEMQELLKDPMLYKHIEEMRKERVAGRWGRIVEAAKKDGVDLNQVQYVDTEIAEVYFRAKESFSMAADINLVVKFNEKLYIIQLDDCALSKKGWVLVDGFRWSQYDK